jgi:hypothetical protein
MNWEWLWYVPLVLCVLVFLMDFFGDDIVEDETDRMQMEISREEIEGRPR